MFSPVPTPRWKLEDDNLSTVAAAWATTPGWILQRGVVTPVPRSNLGNFVARAPKVDHVKFAAE